MSTNRAPVRTSMARAALILLAVLLVAGCDTFFGAPEPPPLPGERLSVLRLGEKIVVDETAASVPVRLPRPYVNKEWPQAGGYPGNAMHHLALRDTLAKAWSADIGESASRGQRMLNPPVAANGRVFTIDAGSTVTAFALSDGKRLWRVDLTPEDDDDDLFGGGLGYWQGVLYVTTPFAKVIALDEATGAVRWETRLPAPMRVPPAISDGRVFVVTIDSQLFVLAADDGRRLWGHQVVPGPAQLLGGPTPAVLGTVMVVAFSSGELYAFQVETGRVLWTDQLAGLAGGGVGEVLTDIHGRPLIDRDLVFAVSYAGTFAAIDLRRGGRAWDIDIGSAQTPWVAGDFLYVLTNDAELVCLLRRDGRVRWITPLPKYEDPEDLEGPIHWSGPVLGGDRLLLTNSLGEAYSVSPYSGKILGRFDLPARTFQAPIIVDGTLLFVSDNAELIALR